MGEGVDYVGIEQIKCLFDPIANAWQVACTKEAWLHTGDQAGGCNLGIAVYH